MKKLLLASAVSLLAGAANAQSVTGTDILNLLVEEGILTDEAAGKLIQKVRQRNERSASQVQEQVVAPSGGEVRVPYVPDYVKDEIKDDVAQEVRGQVLEDVVAHARTERWGIPNAQPAWIDKVKLSGDGRVRFQQENFDDDNPALAIYDLDEVNDAGGIPGAGRDAFVNVTDDNSQLRGRFRLMLTAAPTLGMELGMRLVTGNQGNPVSSNQTLGNYGEKWDANFDLAYLKYTTQETALMVEGGRFKNPFFATDLVWDEDMTFEGVASSWYFLRSDAIDDEFRQWDPFITIGAFPLQEINTTTLPADTLDAPEDKWLYGLQIGTHFEWWNQSRLSLGLSYYDFDNITGVANEFNNDLQDPTAPRSLQFGNYIYNIRVSADPNDQLWALASEYELADLTMEYDYAGFAPYHVVLTADVVKNLAFDVNAIAALDQVDPADIPERDLGYQLGVAVGWPNMDVRGNWRVAFTWRRLEGDAVVDAFADSDFLLGGTNGRGYILRGDYALLDQVYASMRLISADEVDADPLASVAVDRLFLDIGARF